MIVKNPDRLKGLDKPTVWSEFTPLASEHKSFNLGQGFPDWPAPAFCKQAVINALNDDQNQYARSAGHPALVKALSVHYTPLFDLGKTIDPMSEITVSVGASEGLYAAFQGLLDPGDEVIILEPAFDIYEPQIQMAGGVCRYVPLRPHDEGEGESSWRLDLEEFERAFTSKTKIFLLNTPHNPTGKVFSRDELVALAEIIKRHPEVIVVTDEVYEKIIFDGHTHERMGSIPGMWERTLTISSAGKTFSATGFKVGWVLGGASLVKQVASVNQWVQYAVPTPLQHGLAEILVKAEEPYEGYRSYYDWLVHMYTRKRDSLMAALSDAKMKPYKPEGGIFIVADTGGIGDEEPFNCAKWMAYKSPAMPTMTRDWALCRWLTIERGVCAIPPSSFYCPENRHLCAHLARFCFSKQEATLEGAAAKLRELGKEVHGD